MAATDFRPSLVIATCSLVATIEGFDLQAAGVAAPSLAPAFHLSAGTMSAFFSSATLGLMAGAVTGGRITDRMGRRAGLIISLACFGLFSLATSQAADVATLLVLRFLTGMGLGGAMPGLIAIAAETSARGQSATAVGRMYAGMPVGGAIAAGIAMAGWHGGWKTIFVIGGAAPLLVIPLVLAVLPAGHLARTVIGVRSRPWHDLITKPSLGVVLPLWSAFFLTLMILYLMLNWLPSLLVADGLGLGKAGLVQIVFNLAGAASSVAIGRAVDRLGPAGPLMMLYALLIAALLGFAFGPAKSGMLSVAAAAAGAALMAAQAILYGLGPLLYGAEMRGTGVGAAVAAGRLGSIAGPLIAGVVIAMGSGPASLFALLAPVAGLAGGAAFAMLRASGARGLMPIGTTRDRP